MRIFIKENEESKTIPVLIPSVLIFNHITAVLFLFCLLAAKGVALLSKKKRIWGIHIRPFWAFWVFCRFIFVYWRCRIQTPGWKLVEVKGKDGNVTVKL